LHIWALKPHRETPHFAKVPLARLSRSAHPEVKPERIVDGLAGQEGQAVSQKQLGARIQRLGPRWFVMRDAHTSGEPVLLQPRWAMSFLRGPLTRVELRRAVEARKARQSAG
jgi:hypothetical protein